MALDFPFRHLNLRFNPFGELDSVSRVQVVVADLDSLVSFLDSPGRAIQLLDDSGRGKTSLLLAIHHRFPKSPLIVVPPTGIISLQQAPCLFVEEAQFLAAKARRSLWKKVESCVITTHCDYSEELSGAGMAVRTLQPSSLLSTERLNRIFSKRIEFARRDTGPVPRITRDSIELLHSHCGSDIRRMEQILYDTFQQLPEVTNVELSIGDFPGQT